MTIEEFKAKYPPPGSPQLDAAKPSSGRSTGTRAANQVKAARDSAVSGVAPADTSPVDPPRAPAAIPDYGPSADLMPTQAPPTPPPDDQVARQGGKLGPVGEAAYDFESFRSGTATRDALMKAMKYGGRVISGDPRSE